MVKIALACHFCFVRQIFLASVQQSRVTMLPQHVEIESAESEGEPEGKEENWCLRVLGVWPSEIVGIGSRRLFICLYALVGCHHVGHTVTLIVVRQHDCWKILQHLMSLTSHFGQRKKLLRLLNTISPSCQAPMYTRLRKIIFVVWQRVGLPFREGFSWLLWPWVGGGRIARKRSWTLTTRQQGTSPTAQQSKRDPQNRTLGTNSEGFPQYNKLGSVGHSCKLKEVMTSWAVCGLRCADMYQPWDDKEEQQKELIEKHKKPHLVTCQYVTKT